MANQGYLGRKTHPARATDKARALFFSSSLSLSLSLSFCLSFCLSLRLLLSLFGSWQTVVPGRYKGATSLVASLRNQSRELCKYTHVCVRVCVGAMCVCSVTDVCYRLKTCVTDNQARTGGNSEWEWAINAWAAHQLISCPSQPSCLVS